MSEQKRIKIDRFIKLVIELNIWIIMNVSPARMYYFGNADGGYLGYLQDSETGTKIPDGINAEFLEVADLANELFITSKFRIDSEMVSNVNSEMPINEQRFSILVGEKDSFGPLTYILATNNFVIVIC